MDKNKLTRLSFKVHGYSGIILGIFYLFFGITGSVLVFSKDAERSLRPDLHHLDVGSNKVSLDSIFSVLTQRFSPARQIVLNHFPASAHDSYEFMIFEYQQNVTDNYLSYAFVNPYTGEVIGEGNYGNVRDSVSRWLYSAHYCLQMDKTGRLISAIIALLFIGNLITGVIIYRKQIRKVLTFKVGVNGKNSRTLTSSLHRVVGVWSLAVNALLFFSGFWMNKSLFEPKEWVLIPSAVKNHRIEANIDSVFARAGRIDGFTPIAIKVGTDYERDVIVNGRFSDTVNPLLWGKGSDVYFSSKTSDLKKVVRIEDKPFSDQFYWAMKQLHMGHYDSLLIKLIYVLAGLSPALLSITGFLLWAKRKKAFSNKPQSGFKLNRGV